MKIRFTNFRRVIESTAHSGAGESIAILVFLVLLFGGLAVAFREQGGVVALFVLLTLACIYALANEVIGILPNRKRK